MGIAVLGEGSRMNRGIPQELSLRIRCLSLLAPLERQQVTVFSDRLPHACFELGLCPVVWSKVLIGATKFKSYRDLSLVIHSGLFIAILVLTYVLTCDP